MSKVLDNLMPKEKSMLDKLLLEDKRLGLRFFNFNQNSKVSKIVCEFFTLSGDEIIWFGVSAIGGTLLYVYRGLGTLGGMGCVEETFWEMYGSSCTCILCESILKMCFQRARPDYSKQSTFYCCIGEWHSFPSGHALRAFYVLFWLSRNKFVRLLAPVVFIPKARYIIPWAVGVCISRVAKGRHFPLDVVFGAAFGSILGYLVEDLMDDSTRAIVKTIGGIYGTANWGLHVVPRLVDGEGKPEVSWKSAACLTFFFLFYTSLFFATLPPSMDVLGGQTVVSDTNNNYQCTRY